MSESLRDASRRTYEIEEDVATFKEINAGCQQRIADASELMAKSKVDLEAKAASAKRSASHWEDAWYQRGVRINGLRGWATRRKRKIADLKAQLAEARKAAK